MHVGHWCIQPPPVTQEEPAIEEAPPLDVPYTEVRRLPPTLRPHPHFEDIDPAVDPDMSCSRYKVNTGFGTALFDARNTFGEITATG